MGVPRWEVGRVSRWGPGWGVCGGGAVVDNLAERRRLFGRGVIELGHALFEDVAEVFEVVEGGGAEVLGHAAFDLVREPLFCCNNTVGRGDRGLGDIFVFVENGC